MFKKQNKAAEVQADKEVTIQVASPEKETLQPEEQVNNTVVARDVCFEGNLTAVGQVYVYGKVQGNITADDGLVKIMRNGQVNGNITCHELIIDGTVQGECKAESIDICEHANINGALNYATLSVKKGGVFVGSAETCRKTDINTNVIGLTPAPAVFNTETPIVAEQAEAALSKKRS